MAIVTGPIAGVFEIGFEQFEDDRGFFTQTYQWSELVRALGREPRLHQGNHSRSRPDVLRGFHLEPWDKLIYVAHGTALCVVADPRPDSPTFGRHVRYLLGDAPGARRRIFIGRGLANAFYCFTEVDYINDVSEEFDPSGRLGIAWNDPTFAVDWPTRSPILSAVDAALPPLSRVHPSHPLFASAP